MAIDLLGLEKIDLLFTDIIMPGGLDGIELARIAVESQPELNVLLTSGFPESRIGSQHPFAAQFPLLTKPYHKQQLARAVRATMDNRAKS